MTNVVTLRKEITERLQVVRKEKSRLSRVVTYYCPTCHHPIPSDAIATEMDTPLRRQIYEIIRDAGTLGIHQERLEQLLYGDDPNGGAGSNTCKVTICRAINPVLRRHGLIIKSRMYIYRLERKP